MIVLRRAALVIAADMVNAVGENATVLVTTPVQIAAFRFAPHLV